MHYLIIRIKRPLNHYDKGKTVNFIVSVGDDVVIVEMNNNNSGRD